MPLTKSQKAIVLLSGAWIIISFLIGAGIASDNYDEKLHVVTFLATTLFMMAPIIIYWSGVWIWGFGYGIKTVKRFLFAKRSSLSEIPVRPWVRYFAKYFDIGIVTSFILYMVFFVAPMPSGQYLIAYIDIITNPFTWIALVLIGSIIFETTCLALWGTTPGKALLKTSVVNDNDKKLSFWQSFIRAVRVWFRGFGLGIPLITFFTTLNGYNTLKKNKITSWDRDGRHKVLHGMISPFRWLLVISLVGCYLFLSAYVKVQSEDTDKTIDHLVIENQVKQQAQGYTEKTQALVKDILIPAGIDNYENLLQRKERIEKIKELTKSYDSSVHKEIEAFITNVINADLLPFYKKILLGPRLDSYLKGYKTVQSYTQLENEVSDEFENAIQFLISIFGTYTVSEGKLLFSNQADADHYNSMIEAITSLSVKEEEFMKEYNSDATQSGK